MISERVILFSALTLTVAVFSLSLADVFRNKLTAIWEWVSEHFLTLGRIGLAFIVVICVFTGVSVSLAPGVFTASWGMGLPNWAKILLLLVASPWLAAALWFSIRAVGGVCFEAFQDVKAGHEKNNTSVRSAVSRSQYDTIRLIKELLFVSLAVAAPLVSPVGLVIWRASQGFWAPFCVMAFISSGWILMIASLYGLVVIGRAINAQLNREWGVHVASLVAGLFASILRILVSLGVFSLGTHL